MEVNATTADRIRRQARRLEKAGNSAKTSVPGTPALVCPTAMHQPLNIPFPGGIAKVLTRDELERSTAWPNAFRSNCKDHRFYEIVEQTLGAEFEHHYVVLE